MLKVLGLVVNSVKGLGWVVNSVKGLGMGGKQC